MHIFSTILVMCYHSKLHFTDFSQSSILYLLSMEWENVLPVTYLTRSLLLKFIPNKQKNDIVSLCCSLVFKKCFMHVPYDI